MTTTASALERRMRTVLGERSMLAHPFYQAWSAGTLRIEQLQEYARQYYHFEAAFPLMLSAIHTRMDDAPARQIVLDNLWDEEQGARNHRALWLEFAAALGVEETEAVESTPRPETAALLAHFEHAARERPVAEALATLFAYEGQVPAIAEEKIRGLEAHYDLGPAQYEFFTVHMEADIAHSSGEVDAIARTSMGRDDEVVRAVEDGCDALLMFLDGCYAV
jgi:pyrroloquinoline-quinone synthase